VNVRVAVSEARAHAAATPESSNTNR
jgi:hypothetical protein